MLIIFSVSILLSFCHPPFYIYFLIYFYASALLDPKQNMHSSEFELTNKSSVHLCPLFTYHFVNRSPKKKVFTRSSWFFITRAALNLLLPPRIHLKLIRMLLGRFLLTLMLISAVNVTLFGCCDDTGGLQTLMLTSHWLLQACIFFFFYLINLGWTAWVVFMCKCCVVLWVIAYIQTNKQTNTHAMTSLWK